jgi:hypothetical protein
MGTSILHLLPYTVVLQDGATETGNGTEMDLHGKYGSLTVQVFGTFVGTITFEARVTDKSPSDWVAVPATNRVTGAKATTATAAGLYSVNVAEYSAFRARVSAYTSGSIHAVATATPATRSTEAVTLPNIEQTPGSAIPSKAVMVGGSDGTNLQAWKVFAGGTGAITLSSGGGTIAAIAAPADGVAASALQVASCGMGFNGTTWDRVRNNQQGTLLASAARTATVSSSDQTNYNVRGVKVFIDVTAVTGTPSITVAIEEKDSIGGDYKAILTSAAITGILTTPTILTVYPGVTVAANVALSEPLSRTWRVTVTHANADSITYSVSYCYIL